MKSVYKKQRISRIVFLARIIGITLVYYLVFIAYTSSLIAVRYFTQGTFSTSDIWTNGWIIYFGFVAPGLNALSHIIYSERGWLNYKAFVWLHSAFIIILLPIVIFVL